MIRIEKEYIEKPDPPKAGRPRLYPFQRMQVGDHFFVKGRATRKQLAKVRQAVYRANRDPDIEGTFTVCWRTKEGQLTVNMAGQEGIRVFRDE